MTIETSSSSSARSVLLRFADSAEQRTEATTDAAVVQSALLFEQFTASASSSAPSLQGRPYIAISLPYSRASRRRALPSLVVPITSALSSTSTSESNTKTQVNRPIPQEDDADVILPALYRRFFDSTSRQALVQPFRVTVRLHTPVILRHLVLAAQSATAFAYAQTSQATMEQQMHDRLLRQSDLISFGQETFAVVMSEPVLQGVVLQEVTEVFVTFDDGLEATEAAAETAAHGQSLTLDGQKALVPTAESTFDAHLDGLNGNMDAPTESLFAPQVLDDVHTVRSALHKWAARIGRDPTGFDVESCVLLDESSFPQLVALEGDWALAEVKEQGKARVVKILCAPRSSKLQRRASGGEGVLSAVCVPPLLLQNLHGLTAFDPAKRPLPHITLRSLGSWQIDSSDRQHSDALPDCPLPLPFADSMTIARVAGPLSVNRKYQAMFFGALKMYFEAERRVIQQGDIFAVTFDKSKVQWAVDEASSGEDEKRTAVAAPTSSNDEAYDISLPTPGEAQIGEDTPPTNAVVYFCVTDISPETPAEQNRVEQQTPMTDAWFHEMARIGQFGCAVDTSLTKMVQFGVMKSRVIDTQQWLQTTSDTPSLPLDVLDSPLNTPDSVYGQLLRLVQATLMADAAEYGLHLSVLLKGARGSGKLTQARWVAQRTGVHIVELNCYDIVADTDAQTEGVLRARFEQAASCAPALLVLRHIEALARKSQALETGQEPTMAAVLQDCLAGLRRESTAMPVAVIGTTADAERCPTGVLACFRHELTIGAPNEVERRAMLETCVAGSTLSVDVSLKSLATQTAALVASDLVDLVGRAQLAAVERIVKQQKQSQGDMDASIVEAGVALTGGDFDAALAKARLSYSENIGAPKIPNVTWDDVGGLASVKDDILDTIQLPLEHPELFSDGLKKRSGILLYGPPGTGKTLLAKAVATSCSLNFFSVKGPELLNMYIGESEANVRRVFQRARDAKPCVIFFDELDSIAPKRGNQGDSGGVMDRIVSQLLAELDGMSSGGSASDVFVIGATNRPDLLDSALLRPGRFDRMLYLAVSGTHADQLNILQALTRKFKLDVDVGDLSVIAEQCPMNLTGADFYALCSDAMLKSMTRKAEWIDGQVVLWNDAVRQAKADGREPDADKAQHPFPLTPQYYLDELAELAVLDVKVARADFEAALAELVPSVSAQEMQHYRSIQQRFSSVDVGEQIDDDGGSLTDGRDGVLKAATLTQPQQLYDGRTLAEIMTTLQRAQPNGHMIDARDVGGSAAVAAYADDCADELRRNSKGKGKGKALE